MASVTLKLKKFRTTRNLSRVGRLAKLGNRAGGALVRELTRNPKSALTELQWSSAEIGEPTGGTTISYALHQ